MAYIPADKPLDGEKERERERERERQRQRERGREREKREVNVAHTHTHVLTYTGGPYPANIAALFAIIHSGELKPMIPTPWFSSRPSYRVTWFSMNAPLCMHVSIDVHEKEQ